MTQHQYHPGTPQIHPPEFGSASHDRVSWGTSLRVWWGITWRSFVIVVPLALIVGFAAGAIIVIANSSAEPGAVGGILGQLASIPASIIAVHWFMNRGLRALGIEVVRR